MGGRVTISNFTTSCSNLIETPDPADSFDKLESSERVEQILRAAGLAPMEYKCFVYRVLQGMKFVEVADELGWKQRGSVSKSIMVAKEKLRNYLEAEFAKGKACNNTLQMLRDKVQDTPEGGERE